jgi:hypothetical protein
MPLLGLGVSIGVFVLSKIATAIGSGKGASTMTGGPDEGAVAEAVSGR